MGSPIEQPALNGDLVALAAKEGWTITTLHAGHPPAGYVDLAVYQPNPPPGDAPKSIFQTKEFLHWLKQLRYWTKNHFALPPGFQPISGVSGLVIAARRACGEGRKLRQLRIMGHGSIDFFTVGFEQVWQEKLQATDGNLTPMGQELSRVKEYLDPDLSLVVLDCCLCGQDQDLLTFLSGLWGGVSIRGYRDYQYWEHDSLQVGHGVYTECKGTQCQLGVEIMSATRS